MKKLVAIALVLSLVLCLPAFALADITIVQNKPEIDAALQAYAKEYTEKTGLNVKIITGGGSTDYNLSLIHISYLFTMIGLYAGLRREEALALQWDCVFLDAPTPYICLLYTSRCV